MGAASALDWQDSGSWEYVVSPVLLTWLLVGAFFLGLFLLFGLMISAPPPGAH
jgi:hypothetical protein